MKKSIHTEITINTSAVKAWNLLMNFDAYTKWNPFITSISGNAKPGEKLEVSIHPPEGAAMKFKPVVKKVEKNTSFHWRGTLGIPGLFDGTHKFEIETINENQIRLTQSENFFGILVPFLDLSKTEKGFIAMNEAMKKLLESNLT